MQNFRGDNKVHCGLCENVELKNAMVFEKGMYHLWGSMRIYWYPSLWRNRFHRLFSSNHTSAAKRLFQKSLLRGALLKRFFFRWSFLPDRYKRDTCAWGPNMTDMKQFSYQTNWSFVVRKRRGSPAGRNCMIWLSNLHTVKFKNVMPSSSLSHYQRPHPARFLFPSDQSPSGDEGPQTGDCVSSDI